MTAFYDRNALVEGDRIRGPAIIEDSWSTVVIPPGSSVWMDALSNLQIETREAVS
jgi:N-methylhydantoinase A/oxoprolinase/acetone carboxylase beta subunit